jgi:hypothetical protein
MGHVAVDGVEIGEVLLAAQDGIRIFFSGFSMWD